MDLLAVRSSFLEYLITVGAKKSSGTELAKNDVFPGMGQGGR